MKYTCLKASAFSLLMMAAVFDADAQTKKQTGVEKKDSTTAQKDSLPKKNSYADLVKSPQRQSLGLMNLYYKNQKLYLEIPLSLMNKDMLIASTISEISDNLEGLVGSKPQDPLHVRWVHNDSTLLLCKMETGEIAPESETGIRQALQKNSIGAILKLFPVQAYNPTKTTAVIDVTDLFLADFKELSPFGAFSMYRSSGYKITESFKKDRSFIGEIKSFDDNLMVKSHLSYENTFSNGQRTIAKDRPTTVVLTRTMLVLPDTPVRPRIADPRIGVFTTKKKLFTSADNKTADVYFARRWNLVPKDPAAYAAGQLTEPVKPIVFYIDNDFPEEWKPSIREAVNSWQTLFESIGFKNAIVARDFPKNDSTFDPDNLKFNCVRYAPAAIANAIGPSWVDPRSGEIINASVYIFHDVVKLLSNWMFIQTAPADKSVRSGILPDQHLKKGLEYVVRHEIGHCLGFMHNMGASSAIPVDSLRSASFTSQFGTTYSIMDYARFNYVAQPGDVEKGVKLTPPQFGIYDQYIVDWTYTYFPESVSAEKEKEILAAKISAKAGDPRYRYGEQQSSIFDPSSQTEDLGDDAVKASNYGVSNLKYIMQHFHEWLGAADKDYSRRRALWDQVLNQYVRYINHVYSYVGGIYVNEKFEGDPVPHFQSVPRARQEAALDWLIAQLYDVDWIEDKSVLQEMTLVGTPAMVLRKQIIAVLLEAPLKVNLSAIRSDEKNPLTSEEVLDKLFAAVWKETLDGKSPSVTAREMQKAYVSALIRQSKLAPVSAASGTAITDLNEIPGIRIGAELACNTGIPCAHLDELDARRLHAHNEKISAFGGVSVNFNLAPPLEALYYARLKECRAILGKAIRRTADTNAKMHYRLLLDQITKTIK